MYRIFRENRAPRVALVEMFCDRPRPPRRGVAVVETGNEVGRGEEQQFGSRRLVVDSDGRNVDFETRKLTQQPAAERPRPVVVTDDRQSGGGHGSPSHMWGRTPGL